MKRGAIYARVSDPSDLRVASIESQIEAVKAKLVGYKIDQFVERHTAAKLWERVELNKLRERIRSGYYQKVGVYCIDRLSRDGAHLAILFEEAERYNCELFSATEVIENTPEGKLMLAVRGFVAEVERLKIRERTQRGTQRLFDENKIICSGWARFGYKYNKETRTREIEPTAAAIVRRMFELAASGKSIRGITAIFNKEGVPTSYELLGMGRRSCGWNMATVREMLIDPSYYGSPIQWKGKALGGPTPVIVDRATWERAQLTINRNRTFLGTMVELKKFRMLAGMVRCGCGHTMTTVKVCNNKKTKQYYAYYFCMGRREKRNACREPYIRMERVEAIVWEKLQHLVRDPELLRRTIEQAHGSEDRAHLELERESQALEEAEGKIARLIDLLGDAQSPSVQRPLQKKLADLTKQCEQHRTRIVELEGRLAETGQVALGLRELLEQCHNGLVAVVLSETVRDHAPLPSGLRLKRLVCTADEQPDVPPEVKRKVLLALGARIVVKGGEVLVSLDLPLVGSAPPGGGVPASGRREDRGAVRRRAPPARVDRGRR